MFIPCLLPLCVNNTWHSLLLYVKYKLNTNWGEDEVLYDGLYFPGQNKDWHVLYLLVNLLATHPNILQYNVRQIGSLTASKLGNVMSVLMWDESYTIVHRFAHLPGKQKVPGSNPGRSTCPFFLLGSQNAVFGSVKRDTLAQNPLKNYKPPRICFLQSKVCSKMYLKVFSRAKERSMADRPELNYKHAESNYTKIP